MVSTADGQQRPPPPPPPPPLHAGRSWHHRSLRLLEVVRVTTRDQYSDARTTQLRDYHRTSSGLRVLAVLVATPSLCVLATMLADCVPLAAPTAGLRGNWRLLVREGFSVWAFAFLTAKSYAHFLPALPLSHTRNAIHSAIVAVGAVAAHYGLACWIGFPVPFTIGLTLPIWGVLIVGLLWIEWKEKIRETPGIWTHIFNTVKHATCLYCFISIFTGYYYVYGLLPKLGRDGFAFILLIIKFILRAWISSALVHMHDELPQEIVMNVDVYSALFAMYCMQNAQSMFTTTGLMLVDVIQSSICLHGIAKVFEEARSLQNKLSEQAGVAIVHTDAEMLLDKATKCLAQRVGRSTTAAADVQPVTRSMTSSRQIFPQPPRTMESRKATVASSSSQLNVLEAQYVDTVQRLLYTTEFLLLFNYVEVIIPVIYATYLASTYYLPNRMYYPSLRDFSRDSLDTSLRSISTYALLQAISLVVIHVILVRKFRLPGVGQLAFVLEKQCEQVQIKLFVWVFYNALVSLEHFGNDYTFKFAWLRQTVLNSTDAPT